MAGYIFKIVIENTHPPVWRRVMVPDRITFADLHQIIQVLFGWSDEHLHGFQIPSDSIIIDEEGMMRGNHYLERETLIDSFIRSYKWIRYTYDFGDDWRHKIQFEKTDETYEGRFPVLLKAKGDNFTEDSGGIWNFEERENRVFDKENVEQKLAVMEMPIDPELEEVVLLKESMDQLRNLYKQMQQSPQALLENLTKKLMEIPQKKSSPMEEKIQMWKAFMENQEKSLYLVKGQKNNEELLLSLGEKETRDYCKYLRIAQKEQESHKEKVAAIAKALREHPEYLLYVFDEREFAELKKWLKFSNGEVNEKAKNSNLIVKVLALGMGDFQEGDGVWNLSFASDIYEFIDKIDEKTKKDTYRKLSRFDERLAKLMRVYCVLELESLYKMYRELYDKKVEKEDFFRCVYWHARYNDFADTIYRLDGRCYVSQKEIDVQKVLEKEVVYAENLEYVSYPKWEIDRLADDLSNRSEWIDILFTTFHYQMELDIYDSQELLIDMIVDIFSGSTLNELMERLEDEVEAEWSPELYSECWSVLSAIMMDLELPMLRGRNRREYGMEKNISPWTIDMADNIDNWKNTKECHMHEFPIEVQEWMEAAVGYGSDEAIAQLLKYKEKNHICSEEYLFLLAQSCVTFCKTVQAEQLIRELKTSSPAGKKMGKKLEHSLQEAQEYKNEEPEEEPFFWGGEELFVEKPYVRETPKIGRNDPCPCGSGKKYKKCCGK